MTITVELPDDLMRCEKPDRLALKAIVIAGYRSGAFSTHLSRILLGFETRYQLDGFLKQNQVFERSYGIKEYEEDVHSLVEFEATEFQKQ